MLITIILIVAAWLLYRRWCIKRMADAMWQEDIMQRAGMWPTHSQILEVMEIARNQGHELTYDQARQAFILQAEELAAEGKL